MRSFSKYGLLLASGLSALSVSGCLNKGVLDATGSLSNATRPQQEQDLRRQGESLGQRFATNPGDAQNALNYARVLRATDQKAQAVAVLQQASIRNPRHQELLGAYGRALVETGRFKEANEILTRAHTPERPDWRILSTQGTLADQMGDHSLAQRYYEAALKIVPGEPSVLSNLGLSHALGNQLTQAEKILRQASDNPKADFRVRQNLALVFGLQGKFKEAEAVLRRDLSPAETAENLQALRLMVSQPNSWKALQGAGASSQLKLKNKSRSRDAQDDQQG
jgi:Flp pilus assembly protein TadD